jgi:hypothetical protein
LVDLYEEELKIEGNCNYSTGWLQKFKNRHGIPYLKVSGKKLSANHELAENYVGDLAVLVQECRFTPAHYHFFLFSDHCAILELGYLKFGAGQVPDIPDK